MADGAEEDVEMMEAAGDEADDAVVNAAGEAANAPCRQNSRPLIAANLVVRKKKVCARVLMGLGYLSLAVHTALVLLRESGAAVCDVHPDSGARHSVALPEGLARSD